MNFIGIVAAVDEVLLVDWSFFGSIQSSGRTRKTQQEHQALAEELGEARDSGAMWRW
jgi:hypothetical protein